MPKSKFEIVFKSGRLVIARVENSGHEVELTPAMIEKILDTEKFLEQLLGVRVHVNQVHD